MFRSWIRVIEDIVKFLLWNKLYCAQQMIILQKAWELLGASNSFSFPVHERHVGKICFGITMYVFRNISEEWRFKSEKNFQPQNKQQPYFLKCVFSHPHSYTKSVYLGPFYLPLVFWRIVWNTLNIIKLQHQILRQKSTYLYKISFQV